MQVCEFRTFHTAHVPIMTVLAVSTSKENFRGAVLCVTGMGLFIATDTLSKVAVTVLGMPLLQMLALRGVGMVVVHSLVSLKLGYDRTAISISSRDSVILVARVLLEVLSSWCFNLALMHLPMSQAIAVVQALPLAVMLGAALLGEPIGLTGWLLSLLGFVGVLVIIRPSADGVSPWSLCALTAVITLALRDLGTRSLKDSVPSSLVALAASLGLTCFSYLASFASSQAWATLGLGLGLGLANPSPSPSPNPSPSPSPSPNPSPSPSPSPRPNPTPSPNPKP